MKQKGRHLLFLYGLVIIGMILGIYHGNRVITVISQDLPAEREHCIIIDAGHGGEDGGATSCTGKLESAYNLEISLRLRDLMHLMGYRTKMIRTADNAIYTKGDTLSQKKISDLKERVRICSEEEKAILLSIHQNNFSDSRYSGAQVFYPDTEGSVGLAKLLQHAFKATLNPDSHRDVKKAEGIYLMDHIPCTGVLIECGFLSNPAEEAKLRSSEYQRQLCCVIGTTVANYLDG